MNAKMKMKKVLCAFFTLALLLSMVTCVAISASALADDETTCVAQVGNEKYTDIQEAIKAAAPNGTVEINADVTVDKWIMFAQNLSIGNDNLITLNMDGLIINGNGHTLTINSIESAGNGNHLFSGAQNLNIKALTIKVENGTGGISLQSGTISNVTFDGGTYGVLPGTGDVTIEDCTFKTNGTSIYFEGDRDDLVVTGNTFDNAGGAYAILLRGGVEFTNNTITAGKVNVVSGSPVVTRNKFGEERFKVYNGATATIEGNTINNLEFNDATATKSTFGVNTLSDAAKDALVAVTPDVAKIGDTKYETLADAIAAAKAGQTVQLIKDVTVEKSIAITGNRNVVIDLNGHTLSSAKAHVITCYYSNTTITIKDSVGGGKVLTTGSGKHAFVVQSNLVIDGAEISSDKGGNAIVAQTTNANVTIQNNAVINGKVVVKAGDLIITGGTFNNNLEITTGVQVEISAGNFKCPVEEAWCAVGYVPTIRLENDYYSVTTCVARIGTKYYDTLQDAIAAAKDGETITVVTDITLTKADAVKNAGGYDVLLNVAGKSITLDLNGKTISVEHTATAVADRLYAVVCVEDGAGLTVTGNGKIDVTTDKTTPRVAYMFWKRGTTGYLTIENGTFHMNDSEDSIVYTNGSEIVTINGGDFRLDATGTGANGSPWIFNAQGQNERHIMVYGGTFNADVLHQYWIFEAQYYYDDINNIKALVKDEDGIYSFDDAVAYVTDRYYSGNWYTLETGYATLEEAIAACDGPKTNGKKTSDQEVVVLLEDITLEDTITIPAGKSVVLDLNGHSITQTKAQTAAYSMIVNEGTLTINDSVGSGVISYTDTSDGTHNNVSNTIQNLGTLTINGGTIQNMSNATNAANGWPQVIDTDSGSGNTLVTINGGKLHCENYSAIRMFCRSKTYTNEVVINGGEIYGRVDFQNPGSGKNLGKLTIKGGTFDSNDAHGWSMFVFGANTTDGTGMELSVTDGTFLKPIEANYTGLSIGAGFNYGFITGGTFSDVSALKYLAENANVTIKQAKDVTLDETLTVPATATVVLDLNGKNITMESEEAVSMITNKGSLTINGTGKIAYTFNGTPSTDKAANTIENRGVLVVNGGEISNTGNDNQIGYGIDNINGSTLTVNGGKITATGSSYYDSIRLMCGSNDTTVTVNGGEISSIWAQNPSANKEREVNGTVVINGGTVTTTYYENYTTVNVKVAEGLTATVKPYGAGSDKTTSAVVDGYTVYSFVH